jgi:hypothetical protein
MERKAAEDLSIDFQAQSPAHARAGFCFFVGCRHQRINSVTRWNLFHRQRTTVTRNQNGVI